MESYGVHDRSAPWFIEGVVTSLVPKLSGIKMVFPDGIATEKTMYTKGNLHFEVLWKDSENVHQKNPF